MGERHLKMVLSPIGADQQIIDAIAFNIDTAQWPNQQADEVELVYKLDSNLFRERLSVQLLVDHLRVVL